MADYPDHDYPDPDFDFLTPELLRHCVDTDGMDDFGRDADDSDRDHKRIMKISELRVLKVKLLDFLNSC